MKDKTIEFLLNAEEFTVLDNNMKSSEFNNRTDYIKSLIKKDNKNIDINVANTLSDNIEMLNESINTMFDKINL